MREVGENLKLKERMGAAAEAAKPMAAAAKQYATDAAQQTVDRAKELNDKYQLAEKSKARRMGLPTTASSEI